MEVTRREPVLRMEHWAQPNKDEPPVIETWDDDTPEEVCKMLEQFCPPDVEKPARLSLGNDLGFKDYGTGWGANVMLSFDVAPDVDMIEAARADVGTWVKEMTGAQFKEGEDLFNDLVAPRMR